MNLDLQRPLAFFDIESTGTRPDKDRIVEISVLKVQPDGNTVIRTFRVNPECPIPEESTAIHGITDEDVKNEPNFKELAPKLYKLLMDSDLAGFNSDRFDIPLLVEEFYRAGIEFGVDDRNSVDVFKIFQKMERRDLSAAYKFYCDKELVNAHSAEADIKATYEVLMAQLERYDELKNDVEFLSEFSSDGEFVDLARRMVYVNGKETFNFGKHKGRSVADVLKREPQYYDWIMNNEFPRDTKQKLKAIKENLK